jgi:hypothetical protein
LYFSVEILVILYQQHIFTMSSNLLYNIKDDLIDSVLLAIMLQLLQECRSRRRQILYTKLQLTLHTTLNTLNYIVYNN